MKHILQNLRTGKTEIVEAPCPHVKPRHLLIQTRASLISAGTERMLIDFGKAGYLSKAKRQPDKVKQVVDKIQTDGLLPTIEAVRSKLDQPIPLGYCNSGVVLQNLVGSMQKGVGTEIKEGDRVVSNGPHAEVVCVPRNLCAKVPDNVTDEEAALAVVGAIGLQGIRLAQPTLGEAFVVIGLGLIGQLTVQLLISQGCQVLGIDLDTVKCELARQFGAEAVDLSKGEEPVKAAMVFSKGRGVDGVLITAATKSSEPVHQAAQMCRKRGRIVLVGVTGLELKRSDFYEKELSFQVSCSYGPGRYDPQYEEKGHDYPIGYVRWTAQRNFEAVLDMIAAGKLDVKPLISHRFPFEEAERAYELITENKEPYLGIVLTYCEAEGSMLKGKDNSGIEELGHLGIKKNERTVQLRQAYQPSATSHELPVIGLIGAGNFAGRMLLPALRKTGARLKTIASGGGVSGTHLGKKFGFEESTTDVKKIFADAEVNTVFITTRHNTHARFVIEALKSGKHVYVEKPLCLTGEELEEIKLATELHRRTPEEYAAHSTWQAQTGEDCLFGRGDRTNNVGVSQRESAANPILMVGFNRRFAPHVLKMKELLETVREPKSMIMTVNAGIIPAGHWTQDPEVGGGRIIGEACHFIDLLRYIAGADIAKSEVTRLNSGVGDTVTVQLSFKDGSMGTIHYFANGSKAFPKERLEVFTGGRILHLDNFRTLRGYGWKGFKRMRLWKQDKGHREGVNMFLAAVQNGGPAPIPFQQLVEVTRATLRLTNNKSNSS